MGWLALASAPSVLAVLQLGRLHPDEVYQYLEPAFARVHGYGVLAWEWKMGLRNWAFPMVLAGLIRVCEGLGIHHPQVVRAFLALPQLGLHAWALGAAFRWAARREPRGAAFAVVALGTQALVLAYSGRTLGESLSVSFLWVAIEALDRRAHRAWPGLLGGAALGLAVVARYPSLAPVLGAVLFLGWKREWQKLGWAALGGGVVAVALGGLDWQTWGVPFHSLDAYLRFNVLSSEAARRFGSEPAYFYGVPLLLSVPAWVWLALGYEAQAKGQKLEIGLPLAMAAPYGAALLAAAHKESRFLYPAAELLAFAASPVLARAWSPTLAPPRRALLAGMVLGCGAVTWAAVPDVRGDQFRAIVRAMQLPGATGLLIVNEGLWGSGGYFYVGQNVPWATCDWPQDPAFRGGVADPRVNRAVTFEGRALSELQAAGFRAIEQVGRETVLTRDPPNPL